MSRSLAFTSAVAALLALTPTGSTVAKPCTDWTGAQALEEMLPRVRLALELPGTDQVGIDPASRCIGVQVRTHGTARLVKLLLRGVDVPREVVDLRVVEAKPARGA